MRILIEIQVREPAKHRADIERTINNAAQDAMYQLRVHGVPPEHKAYALCVNDERIVYSRLTISGML